MRQHRHRLRRAASGRPASRHVTGALTTGALTTAALVAVALVAACGRGPAPAPAPAPTPAAPAPAAFAYAPGELHALFESRATVHVAGDTTTVTDTVVTRLHATLRLTPGDAARTIAGTVDSVAVVTGRRAGATPAPPLAAPIAFTGTVDGGTVRLAIPPAAATDCSSPAGAYLAIARDLLPSLPGRLTPGTDWSETAESTSCRGGVVLTTTATHRYVVLDTTVRDGSPATRIARTTSYSLTGTGSQAGLPVSVEGRGTGAGELLVDVPGGTLLTTTTHSTLELTFTGAGRVQRVIQDGVQSVTLVP